jgi:hypothetical protein
MSLKRVLNSITVLFAIIGICAVFEWTWEYATRPHAFAKPYSFLILDIENSRNPQQTTRIYLDSPSSAKDVRFEGAKLSYQAVGRPHPQAAVLLPGYVVGGEGRVVFGSAVLDVKDGEVRLNGLDLCRREIIVSRNGESSQGMLRIAH